MRNAAFFALCMMACSGASAAVIGDQARPMDPAVDQGAPPDPPHTGEATTDMLDAATDQGSEAQPEASAEAAVEAGADGPYEVANVQDVSDEATCLTPNICCVPTITCASLHQTCDWMVDNCGTSYECGICPTGTLCRNGNCVVPCGPTTCIGCCQDTFSCLPFAQQSSAACGTEGAACAACATGKTCHLDISHAGGVCAYQ